VAPLKLGKISCRLESKSVPLAYDPNGMMITLNHFIHYFKIYISTNTLLIWVVKQKVCEHFSVHQFMQNLAPILYLCTVIFVVVFVAVAPEFRLQSAEILYVIPFRSYSLESMLQMQRSVRKQERRQAENNTLR
jgi:hypothetical protein